MDNTKVMKPDGLRISSRMTLYEENLQEECVILVALFFLMIFIFKMQKKLSIFQELI